MGAVGYLRSEGSPAHHGPRPAGSRSTWLSAGGSYCRSCPRNCRWLFSSSSWATASSLARSRCCVSSSSSRSHAFSWASRRACARSRCFSASSAPTCADRASSTCQGGGGGESEAWPLSPPTQPRASDQARAPHSLQGAPDYTETPPLWLQGCSKALRAILQSCSGPSDVTQAHKLHSGYFTFHPCNPKVSPGPTVPWKGPTWFRGPCRT